MKEYIGYFKKTNEINKITLYRVEDKETNNTILSFDRNYKVTVDIHFNIKEGSKIHFKGNLLEKDNKNYFKRIINPKVKINKYFARVEEILKDKLILNQIKSMTDNEALMETISINLNKSKIDNLDLERDDFIVINGNIKKDNRKYILEDIKEIKKLYNIKEKTRTYEAIIEEVNEEEKKIYLKRIEQNIDNEIIPIKERMTISYIKGYEEYINKKIEFVSNSKYINKVIRTKILNKDYSDKEKRIKLKEIYEEGRNKPGLYIVRYKELTEEENKDRYNKDRILLKNIRDLNGDFITDHVFVIFDKSIKLIDGNEYIIETHIDKYIGYRSDKTTERYGFRKILNIVNYKGKIEIKNEILKNISEKFPRYMNINLKYFMKTPKDYMFNNIEIYLDKEGIEIDKKTFQTTILYLNKEYFNQAYFRNKQLEKEKYYRSNIYVEKELFEEDDKNIIEYKINIKDIDEIKYTKVKQFSKNGEGVRFSSFTRYNKKTNLPVFSQIRCVDLNEIRNKSEKLTFMLENIVYNKGNSFIADIEDGEIINIRDIIQL